MLCLLAILRNLAVHPQEVLALERKWTLLDGLLLAGVGFSVVSLRRTRGASPLRLRLSVLVDALLVTSTLSLMVIWPHAGYEGALREIDLAAFLVVVVAAGARLSRTAAALGIAANGAGFLGLIALDQALWPERIRYGVGDVALAWVLFAGAACLAWALGGGVRRLVRDGAQATLGAAEARRRLGIYLSPEVARAVEEGQLRLGGQRQEVAVLFTDLRGFTRHAEGLSPEALVGELNAYFEAMVQVIQAEGGVIDKFVGDAIMALFGAPVRRGDPAAAAIRAAAGLMRALESHNQARAAQGRPPLAHGVGVHLGPVVVGNVGAQERMQFTAIGDVVNAASRLESATKEAGVPVLLSGQAVQAAQASGEALPPLRALGSLALRGREAALETWTLA